MNFFNFAEIGGKFINFVEMGECATCIIGLGRMDDPGCGLLAQPVVDQREIQSYCRKAQHSRLHKSKHMLLPDSEFSLYAR